MQKNIDWFSEVAEKSELLSWFEMKMRLKGKSENELTIELSTTVPSSKGRNSPYLLHDNKQIC